MAAASSQLLIAAPGCIPRVGSSPKSVDVMFSQGTSSFTMPRKNKITFAPSASPSASPVMLRRVSSSPGNLHRMPQRSKNACTPAEEMRKIVRSFAANALAVGFALFLVCNGQTVARAVLPEDGTFAAAIAAIATASENAAATAAAARLGTEAAGSPRAGKSLLRLGGGGGSPLRRGGAESNESESTMHADEAVGWDWAPPSAVGVMGEGGDVAVLIGALAVLLVCLLGIRGSILKEHRAFEEAQARAKQQRAAAAIPRGR